MLKSLRVKDFAIIDELNIELTGGFTVLTGETGAGKSIIVDALGLVIGGRGSIDHVRDGCDEAVVEALFEDIHDLCLHEKISGYGINMDGDELIIRRSISKGGKNRLYINGALSTLSALEEICSRLVDIHGQHEHQNLLRKEMHTEYLDAFGRLKDMKNRVRERYRYLIHLRNRLKKLEDGVHEKKDKSELFNYQLSEIKGSCLKTGEDKELASERDILSNSKKLTTLSDNTYNILYESDQSILTALSRIEEDLAEITKIDIKMGEVAETVRSSKVNLRDASESIRMFRDSVRYDPDRLEKVIERIYLIDRLKKKYGRSIEDIFAYQSKIEEDLNDMECSDHEIQLIKEEIDKVLKEVEALAAELSRGRRDAARRLEEEVMNELSLLQMEKTMFVINIDSVSLSQDGFDSVDFMIANINDEPRPLVRIASGGELSRIMLAIKCRLSAVDSVPTMIFDEIDSGIGGRVAEEVGRHLKYLSKDHQVCCVTHLPQIAAMADSHYYVEKILSGNRVVTRVKRLDEKERVEEISRMLGGKDMSKTALKYAGEMLRKVAENDVT